MLVKEYKTKSGNILEIHQDESPGSPRKWDNLGIMACFHNRYDLGDDEKIHKLSHKDFEGWAEMKEHIVNELKALVILPLYLYDHSGVTIATTPFSCRWDSGQVGFIYVTQERLNYVGVSQGNADGLLEDESDEAFKERLTKYLESEVKTYDEYVRGEVYGFKLLKVETCDKGHKHREEIDSCWGFYGDDIKENGILDHISEEDQPIDEL